MTHTMYLYEEHEGTEHWKCYECPRELLIEWSPWKKEVLEAGDVIADHVGTKTGSTGLVFDLGTSPT